MDHKSIIRELREQRTYLLSQVTDLDDLIARHEHFAALSIGERRRPAKVAPKPEPVAAEPEPDDEPAQATLNGRISDAIGAAPGTTLGGIFKSTSIDKKLIQRGIKELIKAGLARQEGRNRGARYFVVGASEEAAQ